MASITARRFTALLSQWVLNPGPPGVIGAAVGLWVALLPSAALEALRTRAVVVSTVAVAWALIAACSGIARQESSERKRLAREARQWTHEIYTLFLPFFSAEWSANHNRDSNPEVSRRLQEALRLAKIAVSEQYFKLYAEPIPNFLQDLDTVGLLKDCSVLELVQRMKQSNSPDFSDVQQMLRRLADIAKDLQK
jgi:hypothetical protein